MSDAWLYVASPDPRSRSRALESRKFDHFEGYLLPIYNGGWQMTTDSCIKTAKRTITQTTPRDSPGTLIFWRQQSLDDLPSPWNLRSKWPTPFRTPQFRPISAHSASTVRAGEKRSISINRKSTTHFPTSHIWTVYVTPKSPNGGIKRDIAVFASKIQLLSKNSLLQTFFVWKLSAAKF